MKTDLVRAFRQKVVDDPSLRKSLARLDGKDVAGMTEIARREGFDINVEDYRAVAEATGTDWKRWIAGNQASSGQLSEADLAGVAGGMRSIMPHRSAGSSSPPTDDDLYCC
jgi:predicted ribosomally synthesized peptide with nif11-like leader